MQHQQGFTLIELMIAIAVIGIIAAVGYPSYQSMMVKTNRGTAQADLMSFASAMERHYATTFSYKGAAAGGSDTGAPAIFATHSPSTEPAAKKKYTLTIHSVSTDGNNFELRATPVSGSPQADDGIIVIYSDGRKGWDKNSDGSIGNAEFCWSC
ncbi:MAG: prepilin-type N-terminal cleavage/methylation domain-containing protein [Alteromonadaceae bacterium]|nr:prepilin-type N-terminal cleavage/methylation domain-containing protein [Alteromonadaceae bacterium]